MCKYEHRMSKHQDYTLPPSEEFCTICDQLEREKIHKYHKTAHRVHQKPHREKLPLAGTWWKWTEHDTITLVLPTSHGEPHCPQVPIPWAICLLWAHNQAIKRGIAFLFHVCMHRLFCRRSILQLHFPWRLSQVKQVLMKGKGCSCFCCTEGFWMCDMLDTILMLWANLVLPLRHCGWCLRWCTGCRT